jgi:class 3 adenylate cyclase
MRWSLSFEKELEDEYQLHYWDLTTSASRSLLITVSVLITLFIGMALKLLPGGPSFGQYFLMAIATFVPLPILHFVSKLPDPWRRYQFWLGFLYCVWLGYAGAAATRLVDIERARFGYGPSLLALIGIYAFTTLPRYWALLCASGLTSAWLFEVLGSGLYAGDAMRHRQLFIYIGFAHIMGLMIAHRRETRDRNIFLLEHNLKGERDRSARLINDMLPAVVAARLQAGDKRVAEVHEAVTVLFADVVGFTAWSSRAGRSEIVQLLDELFFLFDQVSADHGLEKIKTIGDAYMAVSGCPQPDPRHAARAAAAAIAMVSKAKGLFERFGLSLDLRVGLASGSVVAGVIGKAKPQFDVWGATVNLASRMESSGRPGTIQVAETTWSQLAFDYKFSEPYVMELKGLGMVPVRALLGPRAAADPFAAATRPA